MTVNEKIIIMSMNFDNMWFNYHLSIPAADFNSSIKFKYYEKCKGIFTETFIQKKNIVLSEIIKASQSIEQFWEIPKGRKGAKEDEIQCAIREFQEETNISINRLIIVNTPPFKYIFNSNGIRYVYIYYIFRLKTPISPKIRFTNNEQIMEVDNIRWISKRDLRLINDRQLTSVITKIIKISKNRKLFSTKSNNIINNLPPVENILKFNRYSLLSTLQNM
jgi:8-oxo-dGTP pyrophosphatase MutT (NUDIX family)